MNNQHKTNTPYDTGKVKIGQYYLPQNQTEQSEEGLFMQDILLKLGPDPGYTRFGRLTLYVLLILFVVFVVSNVFY